MSTQRTLRAGAGRQSRPYTQGLPSAPAGLIRAAPRTVGAYFLAGPEPDDHQCLAACYRANERQNWISTLCDYGHSVSARQTGPHTGFAGSAFAASLNDLPAFAPFNASTP